jgi:STE24 endopeptidase
VWLVAAVLLWRTTVPSLRLPHASEDAIFGRSLVRDAQRYERLLDWMWVAATLATLVAYVIVVRRARTIARELRLGDVNAGIVLAVLTLTVTWAATLPFVVVGTWWERRHGISTQSYAGAVAERWGQLLGVILIAVVAVALVLALVRLVGRRRWWVAAVPALTLLLLALQFVAPYLLTAGTHDVRNARLDGDVTALSAREHAGHPVFRVEDVSGRTRAANAYSVGLGPSERLVLWNTMLDGRFDPAEVRFVIGHELAHLARNHILRGVAWFGLLLVPMLFVVARLVDLRRPASVPMALLLIAVLQLAVLPLRNAISRRYESEADWIALGGTRDPRAGADLFKGFVATSLQDPSPPGWVHVFLDDHPSALQRVEMTRAWSSRRR